MAEVLKGAPVAAAITADLAQRSAALREQGIVPTLAILRVGENDSDISYERGAIKRAEKAGVAVRSIVLPADARQEAVEAQIREVNADDAIHGCLMFRPLPKHLDERRICELLVPAKDVDGQTGGSLAAVFAGWGEGYAPCTAQACLEILRHYGIPLSGARAAVIGRSLVIGKPVSMLLQAENATVTMCHTKTRKLADVCRQADVLVVAAGRPGMVDASFTHLGQTVIDVGIHVREDGSLCGDVDFAAVEPACGAVTPVPGGVGAVTTAVLCKHVTEAAEKQLQQRQSLSMEKQQPRKLP